MRLFLLATRKWLAAIILLAPILLIVYVALQVLVIIPYRQEQGYTYTGAMAKFYDAMTDGDADGAKYWAGRMVYYNATARKSPSLFGGRLGCAFGYSGFSGPEYQRESYRCLANAHELAMEYEEALTLYEQHGDWPRDEGRVYYKLGENRKAFDAFCRFVLLEKRQLNLTPPLDMHSARVRIFFDRVDGGDFSYEKTLWPFRGYTQFLNFMQREWKATDDHEDYREAMEFLEALGGSQEANRTGGPDRQRRRGVPLLVGSV
jgi:tetratricopeptide (TPR) repeat protein